MPTSRFPESSHEIISERRNGRPLAARALASAVVVAFVGGAGLAAQSSLTPARLAVQVQRAQKLVEELRGLSFDRPVASALLPEKELPALLGKKLVEDLPVPFETYAASLAAVGLIEPSPGLLGRLTNLYSRQVVGFYDPREARFFIVPERVESGAGSPAGMEEALLVHELTHALQDQKLGLARRMDALRESTDGLLALQALLEGEATVVMGEAMIARLPEDVRAGLGPGSLSKLLSTLSPSSVEGAEGVPEYFVKELLFPYVSGTERVQAVRQAGGWAAVNALYRHPPETTLEILHPEKAGGRRRLAPAQLPSAATVPAGSAFLYTDTLGALSLGCLLDRAGAGEAGGRVAATWQDDRVVFFTPKGHPAGQQVGFCWRILCASPAAAAELGALVRPLYDLRPAPARPVVRQRADVVEIVREPAPPPAG